jgi:hypothetical protein
MRIPSLFAGAAFALIFASAATAQQTAPAPAAAPAPADQAAPAQTAPAEQTPSAASAASNTSATTSGVSGLLKTGVTVKDSSGATVGKVSQVVNDSSGQPSGVVVKIGGQPVTLPASSLSANGEYLVAQQTRSQLRSQAQAPASDQTAPQ